MPADTTTTILGLLLQGTGNNNNTWGQLLNEQTVQLIEDAIAGRSAIVTTGGNTALSAAQERSAILDVSGTLASNATLTVENVSKSWIIKNGCTLGGFTLGVKTSSGSALTIPAGTWKIWCDGSDVIAFALPAALSALGALTPAADKIGYFTSASAGALADFTSYGRSIVAVASEAAFKALVNLEIGTDVQAFDSDLSTLAANITAFGHSLVDDANAAAARTTLGLVIGTDVAAATLPTRQVLTSGTGATYTTPAGARQLRIRMVGGGGGGGALTTNAGSNGTASEFNSIVADFGEGGGIGNGLGGAGGASGSGSASFRMSGQDGGDGQGSAGATINSISGAGGNSVFGGAGKAKSNAGTAAAGQAAKTNTGSGGGGAINISGQSAAAGGGAGEYVEIIINSPAASYTYTVGAGGAGGTAGSQAGGNGAAGIIIVDEYY